MVQPTARIVLRRRVWPPYDLFRAYRIVLDGSPAGTIHRRQAKVLEVAPGRHELHLEIDWCRSRELTLDLAPEEEVQLVCKSRVTTGYAITRGRDDYVFLDVVGRTRV